MRCRKIIVAVATALVAPTAFAAHSIEPPAVPGNLSMPAGSKVSFIGHAVGTQNYVCLPDGTAAKWVLFGPQATVFDDKGHQVMTHFLSPNPEESSTPRATWQHSQTSNAIWAVKDQESDDPKFVAPGAVKWLLLHVVGTKRETQTSDPLLDVKFVQRVNTSGGAAPATECTTANEIGKTRHVPYAADYVFYK